jgi:hypothetical protein
MFIWISSENDYLSYDAINDLIFAYSFGLPLALLVFPTIIDLNDNKVFTVWLAFSLIPLYISSVTNKSTEFIIHRSSQFDRSFPINSWMSDYSTSALKSLFVFLVVYLILNQLLKKWTGNFIVNTFRQRTWTNEDAKRKMTSADVLFNIILLITIFCAALF